MENFELIEQYVSGKLGGEELVEFERKLKTDTALSSEVALQRSIIGQINKTRAAELKAMLQNTPVGTPLITDFSALRIAASVIGAGALIAAVYFFSKEDGGKLNPQLSTSIEDSIKGNPLLDSGSKALDEGVTSTEEREESPVPAKTGDSKALPTEQVTPTPVEKPALNLADPTSDVSQENEKVGTAENRSPVGVSKMAIETVNDNAAYSFHYQIADGKLVLFGAFDKGLYELIEINGDTRSLFLFYKDKYHSLDERQRNITPLKAIEDKKLIQKLNQYRQ